MNNQSIPKTPITQKQLAILILIYRYRFLNRSHIQKLLNHKDPRRIKTWLKDLTEKQYVHRIYTHTFGANAKPAVYYLALKSRQILKTQPTCNIQLLERVYTEKTRSERFRSHSMIVADLYIYFQLVTKQNNQTLHFYTSTDVISLDYLPSKFLDSYIAIKETHKKTKRYFVTIIDDHTPRFAIRAILRQWCEYGDENTWQDHTDQPFPQIMLVCPNQSTKKYLFSYINEEELSPVFLLTTREQVNARGVSGEIWDEVS